MGQQEPHFSQEGPPAASRLPGSGIERNHDVAEHARLGLVGSVELEREHVSRSIFLTMLGVQLLNEGIIGEEHAELGVEKPQLGQHSITQRADTSWVERWRAWGFAADEGGHSYSLGIFLASSRKRFRPLSVSGCCASCVITLNGSVATSAPKSAACTKCTG